MVAFIPVVELNVVGLVFGLVASIALAMRSSSTLGLSFFGYIFMTAILVALGARAGIIMLLAGPGVLIGMIIGGPIGLRLGPERTIDARRKQSVPFDQLPTSPVAQHGQRLGEAIGAVLRRVWR